MEIPATDLLLVVWGGPWNSRLDLGMLSTSRHDYRRNVTITFKMTARERCVECRKFKIQKTSHLKRNVRQKTLQLVSTKYLPLMWRVPQDITNSTVEWYSPMLPITAQRQCEVYHDRVAERTCNKSCIIRYQKCSSRCLTPETSLLPIPVNIISQSSEDPLLCPHYLHYLVRCPITHYYVFSTQLGPNCTKTPDCTDGESMSW